MRYKSNEIDFFSAIEFYHQQDTIENQTVIRQNSDLENTSEENVNEDTTPLQTIRQVDFSAIDSILRVSEERERLIREQAERQAAYLRWKSRKVDTTEILYKQFGIAGFPIKEKLDTDPFQQNFLYSIPTTKPIEKVVAQSVFVEAQVADAKKDENLQTTVIKNSEIKPKVIPGRLHFDWITILLLVSFLLLGWIRLFSKKYVMSLFKAAASYQESNTLYREKNSLMERASFMVNLLFVSNIAIFFIQLKHYFNIEFNDIKDHLIYFIVGGSLLGLYVFRAFTSSFIGYVFLKQRVFSEYFHNVNIYTKNTGLLVLPIIVALQFLPYQYLTVFIYFGLILIAFLYVLQIIRSFQIIIRKNVSIFYMILYLCAFEFAPFLIIYKVLLSLA